MILLSDERTSKVARYSLIAESMNTAWQEKVVAKFIHHNLPRLASNRKPLPELVARK
jgi:hypothetical protein